MHWLGFLVFLNDCRKQVEQGIPGPRVWEALSADFANSYLFGWFSYSAGVSLVRYKVICAYSCHDSARALSLKQKIKQRGKLILLD